MTSFRSHDDHHRIPRLHRRLLVGPDEVLHRRQMRSQIFPLRTCITRLTPRVTSTRPSSTRRIRSTATQVLDMVRRIQRVLYLPDGLARRRNLDLPRLASDLSQI
jgi:hypothetical protein